MSQTGGVMNESVSGKGVIGIDRSNQRNQRIQSLDKGKTVSLGLFERISMKYAGWVDGRKGLLRCGEDGEWKSSVLKQEIDAYEEFCAKQIGHLKLEEEEAFKQMNICFDRVVPLRKKLSDAKIRLNEAESVDTDFSLKKEGEENLTEVQVVARRSRERNELLQPLRTEVGQCEEKLSETVQEIFDRLSQVKESFDSTIKVNNRILQHNQRRIDVYWRAAMRHLSELPALPAVSFSSQAEKSFADHYEEVVVRAEKLRAELSSELYGEVM